MPLLEEIPLLLVVMSVAVVPHLLPRVIKDHPERRGPLPRVPPTIIGLYDCREAIEGADRMED